MARISYSNVVDSVMYAMICTRSDVTQAVSVVSRYISCPEKAHWQAVKWILRYLRGISNCYLEFGRKNNTLVGFVDSYYTRDLDRRILLLEYVFCISDCAVSCKLTLQSIVTLSTMEAEYMVMTETIKEALWLKGLFGEFSLHQGVTTIYYDSQSVIHFTKDQMYHERTKHINVKFHFIRHIIVKVLVQKINTKENPANIFTKPLLIYKFKQCLDFVSVCCWWFRPIGTYVKKVEQIWYCRY